MNIAALLAGLFSGLVGAMGLGGGAVLIIYLNLFLDMPQLKAQGINLLFFIPIAVSAVVVYSKQKRIKWKLTLKIALWGCIGAITGLFLTHLLGGEILSKIFGALLICLGIWQTFSKSVENQKK